MKAFLILEDGNVFRGTAIGARREVISEIVFNTSMTGYLEVLTDPSYAGQAVAMTYPLIGNYGVCYADMESADAWPDAYIIRELARLPQNFRSENTLEAFLKERDIPGIAGVDTRALTKILREKGTMNGMVTTNENYNLEEILPRLKEYKVTGVVDRVTCQEKKICRPEEAKRTDEKYKPQYLLHELMPQQTAVRGGNGLTTDSQAPDSLTAGSQALGGQTPYRVALMDFGAKANIADSLMRRRCEVSIYPAFTPAEEVLAGKPDGIMLSNGPGDPAECVSIIEELKTLFASDVPMFGICLGHQLLALANGAKTEKMKYGHRGANHPVKDLESGKVYISTQNHGYMVVDGSIPKEVGRTSFINVNDGTVEGIRYIKRPVFTVQFHPEACAGPQDTSYLFEEFIEMMANRRMKQN
ncbi:MAG: carbamoyl phosphate synthase small subunit [Lachnospiraceae bacterium]|jgi:carbamoyl-phosphate synthase small subunit|nr:carbamoyl phosphate synthase small subunit [Lachnospiraceae bacterium]